MNISIKESNELIKQEAISLGFHELMATVLSARKFSSDLSLGETISPKLSMLTPPDTLPDIGLAAERIAVAVIHKEVIGLETDFDCDGQTSFATLFCALVDFFGVSRDNIRIYIGNRLTEGYGLSAPLAKRILNDSIRPSVVITADNGSSDEDQIKELQECGIDTVVTDHHEIPEAGIPRSAVAVVNPTRCDSDFMDKSIAGCMVAWLVMCATRAKLIDKGALPKDAPKLGSLLDFVGLGTLADCVSMSTSINNRAVVTHALKRINNNTRYCWQAFKSPKEKYINGSYVDSLDLGFKLAPMLNADGRISDCTGSVNFLLASSYVEAVDAAAYLNQMNERRKSLERSLLTEAIRSSDAQFEQGRKGLTVYLENGHKGVVGIICSRIKERYNCPTVVFGSAHVVNGQKVITGSARNIESIGSVNLRHILQKVSEIDDGIFVKFGGHKMAAGCTINYDKQTDFSELFNKIVLKEFNVLDFNQCVMVDADATNYTLNIDFIEHINRAAPYGNGFEYPEFLIRGKATNIRYLGSNKTHLSFVLKREGGFNDIDCKWFNFCNGESGEPPFSEGTALSVVASFSENIWNNVRSFQAIVKHCLVQ